MSTQPINSPQESESLPLAPRSTWKTVLFSLAVVLIVGLVFSGRTLYHEVQNFRARKAVAKATKDIAEENWPSAFLAVQEAMKISPDEPEVLRTAARLLLKTKGDPASMRQILQKLVERDEATDEDKIAYGEALLINGETRRARDVYEKLPGPVRQQRNGLELLAKIQDGEGDKALASETLRKALMLAPDDPECRLRLAILDLDLPFDEMRRAALLKIREISRGTDDAALQAIVFLAGQSSLTPSDAEELRETVGSHPKAEDRHRLVVLSAYTRIFPTQKKTLIDAECEKFKGKGIEDMVQLFRWLAREGEMARILELAPKSLVAKSSNAFPIYAEALMSMGKWAELKAMIRSNPPPMISAASAHALLAQCASKLEPDLAEAKHQISNAYLAAAKFGELQVVARCADLAESLGLWELASEGFEVLASKSPQARVMMLTKVYEMAALGKNGDRMLDAASRISAAKPESWMHRARVDYLRLILGAGLEEASAALLKEDLVAEAQRTPESKSYLGILRSLAAFRMGDYRRAKAELQEVTDPDSLPPGVRAVMAGLVSTLDNNPAQAFRLAEAIPQALLLDEEMSFLKKAL